MGDMTRFDAERLHQLISNHARYTGSGRARHLLEDWDAYLPKFRKVMPVEYRRRALARARCPQRAADAGRRRVREARSARPEVARPWKYGGPRMMRGPQIAIESGVTPRDKTSGSRHKRDGTGAR